jgi:acyl-CoA dehydrogenase
MHIPTGRYEFSPIPGARVEISAIKAVGPETASWVIDRAIQAHGGAGVSQDRPLAELWASVRTLHLADGPTEVHKRTIAHRELASHGDRP